MGKKIMILGASILQLPAIKQAKAMGLDVIAVDINPNAIGFKVPNIKKEIISTIDIPSVIEAAKKHHIDGIMTLATDMPMRTVAAVVKELGLIGIQEETALKATNKAKMSKLKEYEIEKNKRRRNKNSIGQKKLRHLNYRLYIDYHRIYINERRGEYPCRL